MITPGGDILVTMIDESLLDNQIVGSATSDVDRKSNARDFTLS
jgi:hypothetical protein